MPESVPRHQVLDTLPPTRDALYELPEVEDIAGFVCGGLRAIPGVAEAAMCVRGHVGWSRGGVAPACQGCHSPWNETENALTRQCSRNETPDQRALPIETAARRYGFIWLTLTDAQAFAPWQPHARMLANVIGVALESRHQQRKLEAQFRQAQKMEAIGQLAGGVAHDFNNILTAILGTIEMLRLGMEREAEQGSVVSQMFAKGLAQIEHASNRAAALTQQLLAFSRRQASQPKVHDPVRLVRGLETMLRRLLSESITLTVSADANVGSVRVDSGQFEQLLVNLAVNARDAMPSGGKLGIKVSQTELDESPGIADAEPRPGRYAVLAVSDTGCGMDRATQERIFEPFFTTKPLGQGTGLGLSSAYAVVEQAGGHTRVYSEPGQGTTFRVYLPIVDSPSEQSSAAKLPADVPTGHETVLVCEDEESVRELAAQMLERCGYTVLLAEDGADALRVAQEHDGPIHALVTDVVMPDMNGRQLAEALIPQRPEMRVLYVSGYTSDIIAHHGVLDEGVEFLEKPYSFRGLLGRVRQVLDGASTARR